MPITIRHFPSGTTNWKIGDQSPKLDTEYIEYIVANGMELSLVLSRFQNIPKPEKFNQVDSVYWYGDHAKFIIANLL